jgi:prefoldin alpha subunit
MENNQNQNMEQQIYQFQYLREQRDVLVQNLAVFNASLQDHTNTKATLENLKNTNEGEDILVPIGSIAVMKSTIRDSKKVLISISQDIVIEKDLDSAIEFVDKVINQHTEQIKLMNERLYQLDLTLQGMSQLIQQGYTPQQPQQ